MSTLLLLLVLPLVSALKMDVQAHPGHEAKNKERCIRNFVAKDQLVVVTAIVDGSKGDGQQLNVHVRDLQIYVRQMDANDDGDLDPGCGGQ